MAQLTSFLTALLLSTSTVTGLAWQHQRSVSEILTAVYGPIETWKPVYLIDVDPQAIIDGKPVNSSIIYAYDLPEHTTLKQRNDATTLLEARHNKLRKRYPSTCNNAGNWIPQSQLYSGKDTFCSDATGQFKDTNGGSWSQNKQYYWDGKLWVKFKNSNGADNLVYWEVALYKGYKWQYEVCRSGMNDIIYWCNGTKPDSAGGQTTGWQNQVNLKIDAWE